MYVRKAKNTSGPGKGPETDCRDPAFTPGSGIKDCPDCAEKHKGSCMGAVTRSHRSRNLEDSMVESIHRGSQRNDGEIPLINLASLIEL